MPLQGQFELFIPIIQAKPPPDSPLHPHQHAVLTYAIFLFIYWGFEVMSCHAFKLTGPLHPYCARASLYDMLQGRGVESRGGAGDDG